MLSSALVASFFGAYDAPLSIEFALMTGRIEVAVGGYTRRVVYRGDWAINDTTATSPLMRFGPFDSAVRFDRVVWIARGDVLDEDVVGRVELPPGMPFDWSTEVTCG